MWGQGKAFNFSPCIQHPASSTKKPAPNFRPGQVFILSQSIRDASA